MYSKLTNSYIPTNKCSSRNGNKITKITPHHMVAVWSGEKCAKYFRDSSREASANYCIGVEGDICCNVDENQRAWTSSSYWNDSQAITIECANEALTSEYPISQATWKSLVDLCVDICTRYGFKLNFTGDKNGSLTFHYMYANTSCPGPYLKARAQQLCDEVNARLEPKSEPIQSKFKVGQKVQIIHPINYDNNTKFQVYYNVYDVLEVRGNRIVIGIGSTVTSAIHQDNIKLYEVSKPKMSARDFALEVWRKGSYGNGEERKRNAERLGVDCNEAQRLINILANGGNI